MVERELLLESLPGEFYLVLKRVKSATDICNIRGVNDIAKRQDTSPSSFLALDVIAIRRAENVVQFWHGLKAAFQRPGKVPLVDEFVSTIERLLRILQGLETLQASRNYWQNQSIWYKTIQFAALSRQLENPYTDILKHLALVFLLRPRI